VLGAQGLVFREANNVSTPKKIPIAAAQATLFDFTAQNPVFLQISSYLMVSHTAIPYLIIE
jgi:hypothetical protein